MAPIECDTKGYIYRYNYSSILYVWDQHPGVNLIFTVAYPDLTNLREEKFDETTIFSNKKLDHKISNLEDGTQLTGRLDLNHVINMAQNGLLGSTEVPDNQIW